MKITHSSCRRAVQILTVFTMLLPNPLQAQVNILTQHNDNSRSGINSQETALNTHNVKPATFGKLFERKVDGQMYAQPLIVTGLTFPGKGKHDAVFCATEHNSVYAFDANDPKAAAPLWHVNLGPSMPYTDIYKTQWTDMNEEIGITSTPVIDPKAGVIYVEAKSKENGKYYHRLHALNLLTGAEEPNSPVMITATVPGTGVDAVNGKIKFDAFHEHQRPGLLLLDGNIYIGYGAHADTQPFHGWILGYNAKTLKQVAVFNASPNGSESSFWQAGQGLLADADGYIYGSTGNGDLDAFSGGKDYGNSLVKLMPTDTASGLKVVDWFAPFNWADLNQGDTDLGSCGPTFVPGMDMIVFGSKEGVVYVTKRSSLGHMGKTDDSQIIQNFPGGNGHVHGSPIVWVGPDKNYTLFVWTENDFLRAYKMADGKFQTPAAQHGATRLPYGMPGGFMTVTSDGGKPGTGILWASHPFDDNANWRTVPGLLQAFDATDITKELWNSKMNAGRDDFGMFAKFCCPTVANGKVYLATFSRKLVVYGLLPGAKKTAQK
ncbi:MAG: hypothetical protein M3Y28_07660 [Armatimonadota bacterium]|nr:hypothetical protein [Armatimonadota bacterium]